MGAWFLPFKEIINTLYDYLLVRKNVPIKAYAGYYTNTEKEHSVDAPHSMWEGFQKEVIELWVNDKEKLVRFPSWWWGECITGSGRQQVQKIGRQKEHLICLGNGAQVVQCE